MSSKSGRAPCKQCDGGTMIRKKKYVLGAGGAILRFLLMIPAAIMLLSGGIGLIGSREVTSTRAEVRGTAISELRTEFGQKGLPPLVIDDIVEDGRYGGDRTTLSQEQRAMIDTAEARYLGLDIGNAGGSVENTIVSGLSMALIVGGVVMMALGFLIGIRKWKLICDQCGATVDAA